MPATVDAWEIVLFLLSFGATGLNIWGLSEAYKDLWATVRVETNGHRLLVAWDGIESGWTRVMMGISLMLLAVTSMLMLDLARLDWTSGQGLLWLTRRVFLFLVVLIIIWRGVRRITMRQRGREMGS